MEKYPKGSVTQGKEGIIFRVVQNECPEDFMPSTGVANLEDVYMYYHGTAG